MRTPTGGPGTASETTAPSAGSHNSAQLSKCPPTGKSAAVIMAGGYGTRLFPITSVIPKVLLPVGESSVLELILRQLDAAGPLDVHLLLGEKAELIESYARHVTHSFENLHLYYHHGTSDCGSAGPLCVMPKGYQSWLVINGDVRFDFDIGQLLSSHSRSGADLTVCSAPYSVSIPYGVVASDPEGRVSALEEKPCFSYDVSAGINVLGPRAQKHIKQHSDMPDVISSCLASGLNVQSFRIPASWIDIGTIQSLAEANSKGRHQ